MSKMKAISVALMGVAMLAMSVAPVAKAQSTTDVNALIAALQAQIAQLQAQLGQGASTGTTTTFTANLTVGSTGSEVSALQQYLISKGYLKIAAPTGKFAAMTKNAVIALQKALGVSATGYFGPMTRAALNATMVVVPPTGGTTTTTTPSGVLTGSEGSLTVTSSGYVPSNTQVNPGTTDVKVAAVDVKALQGSDMKVTRFDVHFNFRPWLFLTNVSLATADGQVLATMQPTASNVTEVLSGSDYLVRFSGLSLVVPMNTTKTVVVRVSVPSAYANTVPNPANVVFSSNDMLRAVDAAGNSATYSPTTSITVPMVLKSTLVPGSAVMSANANTPAEQVVASSKTALTNNVEVLRFNVKAQDNAGRIKGVTVLADAATTTSGLNAGSIVANATLYDEAGTALQNASLVNGTTTATGTLVFDLTNSPVSIAQDQTKVFVVKINAQQASSTSNPSGMAEGATLTASVATTTYEDANYTSVGVTGTAAGYPVHFYTIAPQIALSSAATPTVFASSTNGANNMAQGHLIVTVKAVGGDIYFAKTNAFGLASTAATALSSSTYTAVGTGVVDTGSNWKVAQDSVATIDLGYVITNQTAGKYVQAWLSSFAWGTTDLAPAANTWTNMLGIGSASAASTQSNKIATPQVYLSI